MGCLHCMNLRLIYQLIHQCNFIISMDTLYRSQLILIHTVLKEGIES